ncbi:hypothetical protein TNCV_4576741 [Trichonephila clavipes]|nr:hypothetical protein TNCV_4576741 [Trichonephila clavipes]
MRICHCWKQEETTDRRGRSHPPCCTTARDDRRIVRMAIELFPWHACSPDLSPIDKVWSMLVQRLARDRPPAANQIHFGNMWKPHGLLYPKKTSKASLIRYPFV